MRGFKQLTAAIAGLALAGAVAGDAMAQSAPFSWTGAYVGLSAGASFVGQDARLAAVGPDGARFLTPGVSASSFSANGTGPIFGLQAGYNQQFGSVVAGLEMDVSGSTGNGIDSRNGACPSGVCLFAIPTTISVSHQVAVSWLSTVRGRLGILVAPSLMAYATGGYAFGEVDQKYGLTDITSFGSYDRIAGRHKGFGQGWTAGGGVEWLSWGRMTVKAEYLFVRLQGDDFLATGSSSDGQGCNRSSDKCQIRVRGGDADDHIVRLGLNFKL